MDLAQPESIESDVRKLPADIDSVAYVAGVPATADPADILQVNFLGLRSLFLALRPKLSAQSSAVFVSSITARRCDWSDEDLEALIAAPAKVALEMLRSKSLDGVAAYQLSKRMLNYWVKSRLSAFVAEGIMQGHQAFFALAVNAAIAAAGLYGALGAFGSTLAGVWCSFGVFNSFRLALALRHPKFTGPLARRGHSS